MVAPEEEALKQGLSITMLCLLAVDWHRRALVRLDDSGLAGFTLAVPGRPGIPSMEVLGAAAPELLDEAFDVSSRGSASRAARAETGSSVSSRPCQRAWRRT